MATRVLGTALILLAASLQPASTTNCTGLPDISSLETSTSFPVSTGDQVPVSCATGYTMAANSDSNITCVANTTYTYTNTPSCQINSCVQPTITNGQVLPTNATIDYGSSYTLICEDMYLASNSTPMTCLEDGTLDTVHTCELDLTAQHVPVEAGDDAVLTCRLVGYTGALTEEETIWTHSNGTTISDGIGWDGSDLTLSISNIQQDAGYSCGILADGAWHYREVLVDVFSIGTAGDLNEVGEVATIACKFLNLADDLQDYFTFFSWHLDGDRVYTGTESYEGARFDSLEVTVSQDQTYACTAHFTLEFETVTFNATASVDAVVVTSDNVLQTQGDEVVLSCVVAGTETSASTYSWTYTTTSSTYNETYSNVNSTHTFTTTVTTADKNTTEGQWECKFEYNRPDFIEALNNTVLSFSLYLDVIELVTVPSDVYVVTGSTANFTCSGVTTSAQSIAPVYSWTVDGEEKTGFTTAGVGYLQFEADYEYDGVAVVCTATWTTPTDIVKALSSSAILHSKYIEVYPNSLAFAGEDAALNISCVMNTAYQVPTTNITWYNSKGNNIARVNTSSADGYSVSSSRDQDSETTTLTIADPTTASYSCAWEYEDVEDRVATIQLTNVVGITTQPTSSLIKSGDSDVSFTVAVDSDQYVDTVQYEWHVNGVVTETEVKTGGDNATFQASFNPGQLFSADSANVYKVVVTFTWTSYGSQTITLTSDEVTLNITDTCHVIYDTLNNKTTVDTDLDYVEYEVVITSTCEEGYLLPKLSSYSYTCSNSSDISFTQCIGGNILGEAPANSVYSTDDEDALALSGGGQTVHIGTNATISCDTGYTLRKSWSNTVTCNGASADTCAFEGDCVIGCEYTVNSYTASTYTTPHNTTLLADQDSYYYTCVSESFVADGTAEYTDTCDGGTAMQITQCNPVVFAGVTVQRAENSLLLSWDEPSYPTTTPALYSVTLRNSELDYEETKDTTDLETGFYSLAHSTSYQASISIQWSSGWWSPGTYNFTTLDTKIVEDKTSTYRKLDIPALLYTPEEYQIVMTYVSSDYPETTDSLVYVYYSDPVQGLKKRDTTGSAITVFIYASADELLNMIDDEGVEIGAYVYDTFTPEQSEGLTHWPFEAPIEDMERECTYLINVRACQSGECIYGETSSIVREKDDVFIILVVCAGFIVVLITAVGFCMLKGPCRRARPSSMDSEWVDENGVMIRNSSFEMYVPKKGELKVREEPEEEANFRSKRRGVKGQNNVGFVL